MSHLESHSHLIRASEGALPAALAANEKDKSDKVKKSAKALLSELEALLVILEEGQSETKGKSSKKTGMDALSKGEKAELEGLLKGIASGKTPVSKLEEAFASIASKLGKGKSDLENVLEIAKTALTGNKGDKKLLIEGLKLFNQLAKASDAAPINSMLDTEEATAFFAGLTDSTHQELTEKVTITLTKVLEGKDGDDKFIEEVVEVVRLTATHKTAEGAKACAVLVNKKTLKTLYKLPAAKKSEALSGMKSKATPKGEKKESVRDAIFALAMCLQSLLGSVYNAQVSKNAVMNKVSDTQRANATNLLETKLTAMQQSLKASADAQKPKGWQIALAVVLVIAGGVLAAVTGGVAAAVVAVVIGGVMAAVGGAMTKALVKAMVGDNPTPAAKAGATVAATVIITLIVTVLSVGAAGASTAIESAAEGAADGASTAGASAAKAATTSIASDASDEVGIEMTDMTGKIAEKVADESEKAVSKLEADIADAAENLTDGSTGKASLGTRVKGAVKGIMRRFIGQYLQGFIGNGGLTESARAIMLSNPDWKKGLESKDGAIAFAIISSIVAVAGSIGAGKLAASGESVKADFFEKNNLKMLVLPSNKVVKAVAQGTQVLATAGSGIATISQYFIQEKVVDAQEAVAEISSQSTMGSSSLQTLQGMQKKISESAAGQEKHVNAALQSTLNSLSTSDKNSEIAVTS